MKCGANAECVPERHAGQCRCKAGYSGNAAIEKGCHIREVTCKTKTDCLEDQYCNKGACVGM